MSMKLAAKEFFRRGLIACGCGPVVLAVIYLIVQRTAGVESLSVNEVCVGIFSLTALAFVAGGMNAIYRIERLPLMAVVSIHGGVLYVCYLLTYLVNNWLEWGMTPILGFTGIFAIGYLLIWAAVYAIIKRNTEKLNAILKQKQQEEESQ